MSRNKRYFDHPASRRKALADVTHEHDGGWRDPMAVEMIAKSFDVDLAWLTAECKKFEVLYAERLEERSRLDAQESTDEPILRDRSGA